MFLFFIPQIAEFIRFSTQQDKHIVLFFLLVYCTCRIEQSGKEWNEVGRSGLLYVGVGMNGMEWSEKE